jgi:hypothetical protein
MEQSSGKIDLTKIASDSSGEVPSMVRELEGHEPEKASPEVRWPTRFISSGVKTAPKRWPMRFIASGGKSAPRRK